ncbi:DNase I-like protein [Rickenella mellea]|uniref:DNase I-like protein n=1 Tax=Rickenella mellea TaxID=50990 RepID=A0A4Y7QK19_9AGAM|nr:DNase I-like protein [Rickenella mellea]
MSADTEIRSLLRPSERVIASLRASASASDDKSRSNQNVNEVALAVIAHVDSGDRHDGLERGSVIVLDSVSLNPQSVTPKKLRIISATPITSELTISIAQGMTQGLFVLTLQVTTSSESRSRSAHETTRTFTTSDSHALSEFTSACRRFQSQAPNEDSFAWLASYAAMTTATSAYDVPPTVEPQSRHPQTHRTLPIAVPVNSLPLHECLSSAAAGQPGDEDKDIAMIKEDWVRRTLDVECAGDKTTIRIRIGSFNVNGKYPSQDLHPWLRKPSSPQLPNAMSGGKETASVYTAKIGDAIQGEPDLFVLGFQELDLAPESLLYSTSAAAARVDAWTAAIFAGLGELRDEYQKIAIHQLVGMLIIILAKKSIIPRISQIRTASLGTGLMGIMGNKGAVGLRLVVSSTSLTFVNSHLAAADEMLARRNSDFHDLERRLVFPGELREDSESHDGMGYERSSIGGDYDYDADMVASGDLNYRIDLPDADVRALLSSPNLHLRELGVRDMVLHDQLKNVIKEGQSFKGFLEGDITHLPTYRFATGLSTDALGYDMKWVLSRHTSFGSSLSRSVIRRRPAWTDRVLWMSRHPSQVNILAYAAHSEITMSDHRPLAATFEVKINDVDKLKQAEMAATLFEKIGNIEDAEATHKLKLASSTIDLGAVSFRRPVMKQMELQNIGKIASTFRFVPMRPRGPIHAPWLSITPLAGLILPGETMSIIITAFIDERTAAPLNMNPNRLDETLILHTARGKDHFVSVTGQYQPTCFANSLSWLVRLHEPIRSTKREVESHSKQLLNAPKEIMRLVNWLMSHATNIPGLFITRADEGLVDNIRDALDTGNEISAEEKLSDPHVAIAVGETLLRFLDSLTTPVVPASIHARCMEATSRDEAFEILDQFPEESVNVWISITAFLHFVLQQDAHASKNVNEDTDQSTRANIIAAVFAPILLRDDAAKAPRVSPLAKRKFLLYFIT